MILSDEEFMNTIKSLVGDNCDDNTIKAVENITDTFNAHTSTDNENWKQKYEENDNEWRKKYQERFFSGTLIEQEQEQEDEQDETPKTYSDLFTER